PAPPRSLSRTVPPAGAVCCAASCAGERVSNRAAPIAATLKHRLAFGLIDALLACLGVTAPAGGLRSGSRGDESNAAERSRAYPCTVHHRPQRRRARREPPDRFFGPTSTRALAVPWASYGASGGRRPAALRRSSAPRLASTGAMRGVQRPFRLPCCMS